mmetsp:Transcript_24626/g.27298  ORF Transcript_24626/g.27298 Transcript_24626/m.27298 type:complete len:315 (-) Transcript_24626:19-963(-)
MYTINNKNKGPEYTVGSRYKKKENKTREYDRFYDVDKSYNATQGQSQNTIIGKSKRNNKSQKEVPGPGHYSIKELPKGLEHKLDKYVPKDHDEDRSNDRFYEVTKSTNAVSRHVPVATMGKSKREGEKPVTTLGPGHYSAKLLSKGPAHVIAEKHDNIKTTDNENDKYYNVKRGFEATMPNSQAAFTEKSVRKGEPITPTPGVGSYDIKLDNKRGGVTMGAKHKPPKDHERAPGPGAYKPSWDEAGVDYTYDIRFGKADRLPEEKYANFPGPGLYKPVLPWDKGPTIGTGERTELVCNNNPGPGDYNLPTMVPV